MDKVQKAAYNKAYRQANKDKLKAYYRANREKVLAACKKHYQANKEKVLASVKAYRNSTKEERKAYRDAYSVTFAGRYAVLKKGAKKRGIAVGLTLQEYELLVTNSRCHYCGGELSKQGGGLDRKNNERFYRMDNCVPCCTRCNFVFGKWFSYKEKLILSETLKDIDCLRLIRTN